jgi:hypothetical protein
MKKQDVLEVLKQFPEEFDAEQFMHHVYLRAKLEQAEEAVARNQVLSHEEVVRRSRQWFE